MNLVLILIFGSLLIYFFWDILFPIKKEQKEQNIKEETPVFINIGVNQYRESEQIFEVKKDDTDINNAFLAEVVKTDIAYMLHKQSTANFMENTCENEPIVGDWYKLAVEQASILQDEPKTIFINLHDDIHNDSSQSHDNANNWSGNND